MRWRTSCGCRVMSADTRTVAPSMLLQSSSALANRSRNVMALTSGFVRPCCRSAVAKASSLENRKKSGPGGRSAGGVARAWISPGGEAQPPAGTQHAHELTHGALWTREVHDCQVGDDGVEGGLGVRQFVRIRATE